MKFIQTNSNCINLLLTHIHIPFFVNLCSNHFKRTWNLYFLVPSIFNFPVHFLCIHFTFTFDISFSTLTSHKKTTKCTWRLRPPCRLQPSSLFGLFRNLQCCAPPGIKCLQIDFQWNFVFINIRIFMNTSLNMKCLLSIIGVLTTIV